MGPISGTMEGMASIFYDNGRGLWTAKFTVTTTPRRNRVVRAKTREALDAKIADLGLRDTGNRTTYARSGMDRRQKLAEARKIARHIEAQFWARVRAMGRDKHCPYCEVPLSMWNGTKDHIVPLVRGGDDSLDNLQYICWQCNVEKKSRTHDEWQYTGPVPRPFRMNPKWGDAVVVENGPANAR